MNILTNLIRGQLVHEVAIATPATVATEEREGQKKVAEVATVAVAVPEKQLHIWCSRSCPCLEELLLPDGKVVGCVQEHPDWEQVWRRLTSMKNCPLQNQKELSRLRKIREN